MKNNSFFYKILIIYVIIMMVSNCTITVDKGFGQAKFPNAMELRKIAILPFAGTK